MVTKMKNITDGTSIRVIDTIPHFGGKEGIVYEVNEKRALPIAVKFGDSNIEVDFKACELEVLEECNK